jgi:hypothetical protein
VYTGAASYEHRVVAIGADGWSATNGNPILLCTTTLKVGFAHFFKQARIPIAVYALMLHRVGNIRGLDQVFDANRRLAAGRCLGTTNLFFSFRESYGPTILSEYAQLRYRSPQRYHQQAKKAGDCYKRDLRNRGLSLIALYLPILLRPHNRSLISNQTVLLV